MGKILFNLASLVYFYYYPSDLIIIFILLNLITPLKRFIKDIKSTNLLSDSFIIMMILLISFGITSLYDFYLNLVIINTCLFFINYFYINNFKEIKNLKTIYINILDNNYLKRIKLEDAKKGMTVVYNKGDTIYTVHDDIEQFSIASKNLSLVIKETNNIELEDALNNFINSRVLNIYKSIYQGYTLLIIIVATMTFLIFNIYPNNELLSLKYLVYILLFGITNYNFNNYIIGNYYAYMKLFKKNIVINSFNALYNINEVDTLVLDKSHILLQGDLKVVKGSQELINIVASLEKNLNNHIAKAIKNHQTKDITFTNLQTTKYSFGYKITSDDGSFLVGGERLMTEYNLDINFENDANTIIYVYNLTDNKYLGSIHLNEKVSKQSINNVKKLKKIFKNILILSGDNFEYVKSIANTLKINQFYPNVSRDEKLKYLKLARKENNQVLFVGNPQDDTKLFKESYISAAYDKNIADITLLDNDLTKLADIYDANRRVRKASLINNLLLIIKVILLILLFNSLNITLGLIITFVIILISVYTTFSIMGGKDA